MFDAKVALFILLIFFAATIGAMLFFLNKVKPAKGFNQKIKSIPNYKCLDLDLKEKIDLNPWDDKLQEELITYFYKSGRYYSNSSLSSILFPGSAGTRGRLVEGLEGFARLSTPLACWVLKSNNKPLKTLDGANSDVNEFLIQGLNNGMNPYSRGFWGGFEPNDQRIVEAADIAITTFLLAKYQELNPKLLLNTIAWLKHINHVRSYEGNWLLFRVVVNLVLAILDDTKAAEYEEYASLAWLKFKKYHVGNGWFTDGIAGNIDYYNVWQMQYMLYWISTINDEFDNVFINDCLVKFSADYQYFISPKGVPIFGRSCCYKFAAAVPFLCKALSSNDKSDLAQAHKANQLIWRFYSKQDGLKNGNMTQGYFGDDVDLLENYSGRASALWGLRSLSLSLMAFYGTAIESDHICFPIEKEDFSLSLKHIGFTLKGKKETGEIIVFIHKNSQNSFSTFKRRSRLIKLAEKLLSRPIRVENFEAKYKNPSYSNLYYFFSRER